MKTAPILLAALFLANIATAQETPKPGTFYAAGLGNTSCGSFLTALERHQPTQRLQHDGDLFHTEASAYKEWTLGFLAAFSAMFPTNRRTTADAAAAMQWLKLYCQKDPTTPFATAVYQYGIGAQLTP